MNLKELSLEKNQILLDLLQNEPQNLTMLFMFLEKTRFSYIELVQDKNHVI